MGVTNTTTVLTPRLGALTQSTGIAAPIYLDFYLPDRCDSRWSQISLKTSTKLSQDENPAAVVTMKHLAIHYQMETYTVGRHNGKICAIFPTGCCSIPEQAKSYLFVILSTPTSVLQIQFQTTQTGTTPSVAQYIRSPGTSDLSTSDTLPVTGYVSSEEKLHSAVAYLAEIKEALDKGEQELKILKLRKSKNS